MQASIHRIPVCAKAEPQRARVHLTLFSLACITSCISHCSHSHASPHASHIVLTRMPHLKCKSARRTPVQDAHACSVTLGYFDACVETANSARRTSVQDAHVCIAQEPMDRRETGQNGGVAPHGAARADLHAQCKCPGSHPRVAHAFCAPQGQTYGASQA